MRGNAWQITAIIAIILVVVLMVPLVIMGRNHQTLSDSEKQAREEQRTTAQKAATAEGEVRTLKTLIRGSDIPTLSEIQTQHTDIMGRAMPGENDSTRSYHDVLTALLGDLAKEREAHKATQDNYAQLNSDFNNAKSSYDAVIAGMRAELRRGEADRQNEQRNFEREKINYARQLRDAQDQQAATLSRTERQRHELAEQVNQLEVANKDIVQTNTHLASLLDGVRNPNVEHPAGKIISIDQQAGLAHVNLGSADGLMVRTMFSVYHSSITGLSFRTAPAGEESVYCDVCRRDIARDVSKASVEVTKVLGPHRAEVRILDDILTDPILVGDVVYSPIWKPGQKLRFALTAGMHLPGSGIDSGVEAVKRLIEMNGGIVDCWINESASLEGDHLVGSIDGQTNFIVVNKSATRNLAPEIALIQEALLEDARNRVVKEISLENLLIRLGWRNVTPVYTFGSKEFMPDIMRVVPQHPGTVHQSGGVVSSRFTPDNAAARVNARDANPVRTSPGTVAPLFSDTAPPPPNSSGRTSNLFRSRSPVAGQN